MSDDVFVIKGAFNFFWFLVFWFAFTYYCFQKLHDFFKAQGDYLGKATIHTNYFLLMVCFLPFHVFSSSSMLIEMGTVVVDFSLGFNFDSAPAFCVYFDFVSEVYFGDILFKLLRILACLKKYVKK